TAPLDIEEKQNQADGTHTLLTSKVPLRDGAGHVVGMLGIYVDITERKRMEEELRQARDAPEAAARAKAPRPPPPSTFDPGPRRLAPGATGPGARHPGARAARADAAQRRAPLHP